MQHGNSNYSHIENYILQRDSDDFEADNEARTFIGDIPVFLTRPSSRSSSLDSSVEYSGIIQSMRLLSSDEEPDDEELLRRQSYGEDLRNLSYGEDLRNLQLHFRNLPSNVPIAIAILPRSNLPSNSNVPNSSCECDSDPDCTDEGDVQPDADDDGSI